jgi:hypothetical protein
VRTKQSFLSAIAAIAGSVSGKRCPLALSWRPSLATNRQSSQVGSRACRPFSDEGPDHRGEILAGFQPGSFQ